MSRRRFLRGAGASVALPFLDVMRPHHASAQASAPPVRFLAYFAPNGLKRGSPGLGDEQGHLVDTWTPSEAGRTYRLTPTLEPIAPVQDHVLVITGLDNLPGKPDGTGDHASGTGAFLSATHVFKTEGRNLRNGVTIDQVIAREMGGSTRFRSLELGAESGAHQGGCCPGYSCAYNRHISWSSPTTPVYTEVSPRALFDRLFQGRSPTDTVEQQARRQRENLSILDFVLDDVARLKARLGGADARKLNEYLESVRDLERRIQTAHEVPTCDAMGRPGSELDVPERVEQLTELMVLAFRCDLTRVITFMLGNGASGRTYKFLDLRLPHHHLSHHAGDADKLAQLLVIDRWQVAQFASLVAGLAAVPEGDGTLLDSCAVFFSSEVGDGNAHDHVALPVLLAGKAGGAIAPGRHLVLPEPAPMGDLFLSLLAACGVSRDRFGDDGTKPLRGLTL